MPKFFEKDHLLESPELLEAPTGTNSTYSNGLSHHPLMEDDDNLVRTLISWRAPARPFRKKDRSYFTTVATLILLLSMISLLTGQVLLIFTLLGIGFVIYALNSVPPEDIDYKLSTQGVTIGEHFYHWDTLDSFWFNEKENHQILNILTHLHFPAMLIIILDGVDQEAVKKVCASYLPFHEIAPKSTIDKWSESLQKHFPLENPHH